MDIGRAFLFIWEDERKFPKLAMGTGVALGSMILSPILIGLVGFLIMGGYTVRLIQNVRDGDPTPLPEWDQWGDDLTRGLKYFAVGVVWAAPMIVVNLIQIAVSFGAGALDGNSVGAAIGVFSLFLSCIGFIFGIFVAVVMPGFSLAFAENEQISDGLAFGNVFDWTRENIGDVIITVLFLIVAGIAIGIAAMIGTLITCIVGAIVVLPLAALVNFLVRGHLFGQLGRLHPYGGGSGGGTSMSSLAFESPLDSSSAPLESPPAPPSTDMNDEDLTTDM